MKSIFEFQKSLKNIRNFTTCFYSQTKSTVAAAAASAAAAAALAAAAATGTNQLFKPHRRVLVQIEDDRKEENINVKSEPTTAEVGKSEEKFSTTTSSTTAATTTTTDATRCPKVNPTCCLLYRKNEIPQLKWTLVS